VIETVTYHDGTTATGAAPMPKRSPAEQERDHLCSLRRQLRFLESKPVSNGYMRREIPALRWAIERLQSMAGGETPNVEVTGLRRED
jgi:hypothetical protein